jgi:hypothetical protein
MKAANPWRCFVSSVAGKYHLEQDNPNQDSAYFIQKPDYTVAVVCDGAGSATYGGIGAKTVAKQTGHLISLALEQGPPSETLWTDTLAQVRTQLEQFATANGHTLKDYSCTVVGLCLWQDQGWFFHIGDGFALVQQNPESVIISQPENGEFSDETYFLTSPQWYEHCRITVIPAQNPGAVIGLMSDGSAPFVINRNKTGFFPEFILPVINYLNSVNSEQGNEALSNLLNDEKTWAITTDDKTLFLAILS